MPCTPKINRVWNKHEKRIVRLLYRKGLIDMDISELYWESYRRSGKRYRNKKFTYGKLDNRLDEIHFATFDYWGECDEYGLVSWIIEQLTWDNVPDELNDPMADDLWEVYHQSTFKYKGRRWFIRYLKSLPTVRCDSKINKVLKIKNN